MCHNVSGHGYPTKMHKTKDAAITEASRLARHHMGNQVVVLEVVDCYQAVMPDAVQINIVDTV